MKLACHSFSGREALSMPPTLIVVTLVIHGRRKASDDACATTKPVSCRSGLTRLIARCAAATVLALALMSGVARAMTLVPMTTAEMVEAADWVVRGTVESATVGWNESGTMVYTWTTIRVDEPYGPAARKCPAQLVICQPGGRVGNRVCVVPGMPEYRRGEDVVVFLERRATVQSAKHAAEYMPVGAVQGKYTVMKDGRALRSLAGASFVTDAKVRSDTSLDKLVEEISAASEKIEGKGGKVKGRILFPLPLGEG